MCDREELRCNQKTAMKLKETTFPTYHGAPEFGSALGIPVVISTNVPDGKMQLWSEGEMVSEFDV
jgi:hypothetical protein